MNGGDFYDLTHEGTRLILPRITSILGVLDKSGPLMGWAVNLERAASLAALEEALTTPGASNEPHLIQARYERLLYKKRQHVKAKEEAADIGTKAHEIIRWHVRRQLGLDIGPEPSGPDASLVAVTAWLTWCQEVDFTPIIAERTVYCPSCAIAGTLDVLAKINGVITVADWKSSKAIYSEMHAQVRFYKHALARENILAERAMLVRLPKVESTDPKAMQPEAVVARDMPIDVVRAIAKAWRAYRWLNGETMGNTAMTRCDVVEVVTQSGGM